MKDFFRKTVQLMVLVLVVIMAGGACNLDVDPGQDNNGIDQDTEGMTRSLSDLVLHLPFDAVLKSLPLQVPVPWGFAVVNNSVTYSNPGVMGTSFNFDGSALSYVDVPDNSAINFGTGDFTLSGWVKTSKTGAYNTIIEKRDITTGIGYHFILYYGHLLLQITTPTTWANYWGGDSAPVFNDNKWHFVSVAVDRDNSMGLKMYADGRLIHILNPMGCNGNINNTSNLFIGKHKDISSGYFEGSIDNVKLFKAALTEPELASVSGISVITDGQTSSNSWTADLIAFHRAGRYAKYFTFTLTARTSVKINLNSSLDTYLFLLSSGGIEGAVVASDDDSGDGLNSQMTMNLNPGVYMIEATTYANAVVGAFTVSLNLNPWKAHLADEIETKWEADETKYNAMVAAFPNGSTKYGYSVYVKSTVPKKYVDYYYDQSSTFPLNAARHSLRNRYRYTAASSLPSNPTLAQLEGAVWLTTPDYHRVQYKSTPLIILPVWFRSETSVDVTSDAAANAILNGTNTNNLIRTMLLQDHPSFNFSLNTVFTTITSYRYRIELQISGVSIYEISLDRINVNGTKSIIAEMEQVEETTRTESDIWNLFDVAALMQSEFNLTPALKAKYEC